MRVIRTLPALKTALSSVPPGRRVGFVPTMGALHEGHLSLVRRSNADNDVTVVSIFVNPIQFNSKRDFKAYPKTFGADSRLLKTAKADILFMPSASDFYPEGFQTTVTVDKVARPLCGKSRPGHFAGVATVVLKLLNLVRPHVLYLGQKDYQQCRVIERLVEDLSLDMRVRRMPIVREKDGLAMSSRNVHLNRSERRQAAVIRKALLEIEKRARKGEKSVKALRKEALKVIRTAPLARVDYVEIVDAGTLENVLKLQKQRPAVAAAAVFFGNTRLIDNTLIKA